MKLCGRLTFLLVTAVLLLYLTSETEARGGRGGGGGRGGSRGGSRGRSRGWGWGSGGKSKGSVGYGGGLRSGGYASFGSPSRWSNVGGRRIYYVGYYHGHRPYYGGHYTRSENPYKDRQELFSALSTQMFRLTTNPKPFPQILGVHLPILILLSHILFSGPMVYIEFISVVE